MRPILGLFSVDSSAICLAEKIVLSIIGNKRAKTKSHLAWPHRFHFNPILLKPKLPSRLLHFVCISVHWSVFCILICWSLLWLLLIFLLISHAFFFLRWGRLFFRWIFYQALSQIVLMAHLKFLLCKKRLITSINNGLSLNRFYETGIIAHRHKNYTNE